MKAKPLLSCFLSLIACTEFVVFAHAQSPASPNEGYRLTRDPATGASTLSWWGRAGITYFIQHSDDLIAWDYLPVIESGGNEVLAWGFTSSADKFFLRLRFTDAPTSTPADADFDGDGVSNWQELLNHTDPLQAADTDGDGLPDDWERAYFHEDGLDDLRCGATDDTDDDGLTTFEEFQAGTNPNKLDSDDDGVDDAAELLANTSPIDPAPVLTITGPPGATLSP